ncbi:MAG: hypothetical protein QOK23_3167 [Gammaproteobacteria bacterium]|jgi:hypothetical protein|nr:hypothetical protein [Gammaproteobacteria bacterium]
MHASRHFRSMSYFIREGESAISLHGGILGLAPQPSPASNMAAARLVRRFQLGITLGEGELNALVLADRMTGHVVVVNAGPTFEEGSLSCPRVCVDHELQG